MMMSQAAINRRQSYKDNFCNGFQKQNSAVMDGGSFTAIGEKKVMRCDSEAILGDIVAHFIAQQECKLTDLLPVEKRQLDPLFTIPQHAKVFFEPITIERGSLAQADQCIESSVAFHRDLKAGLGLTFRDMPDRHILILVFNGADHVQVFKKFTEVATAHDITGTAVFLPSDVCTTWQVYVELEQLTKERQRIEAERDQRIIEAQERTKALESKANKFLLTIAQVLGELNADEEAVLKATRGVSIAELKKTFPEELKCFWV